MTAQQLYRGLDSPPLITLSCRLSLGSNSGRQLGTPASGVSPWSDAANKLLAFPFVLERQTTIYKAFWLNGSAAGGNSEAGIWDSAYNKIVTTGSIAGSGNSAPQAADLTDTTLDPGLYYAGMAHNATTTNQLTRWSLATLGIGVLMAMGCWTQTGITLGSLASTATPGDMTNVAFPVFGLITRSNFDL